MVRSAKRKSLYSQLFRDKQNPGGNMPRAQYSIKNQENTVLFIFMKFTSHFSFQISEPRFYPAGLTFHTQVPTHFEYVDEIFKCM